MPKYGDSPSRFAAYVVYQDTKPRKGKQDQAYTARLSAYPTLEAAKLGIAKNEDDLRHPNTYGGLIDWGPRDEWERKYRIFKVTYAQVIP